MDFIEFVSLVKNKDEKNIYNIYFGRITDLTDVIHLTTIQKAMIPLLMEKICDEFEVLSLTKIKSSNELNIIKIIDSYNNFDNWEQNKNFIICQIISRMYNEVYEIFKRRIKTKLDSFFSIVYETCDTEIVCCIKYIDNLNTIGGVLKREITQDAVKYYNNLIELNSYINLYVEKILENYIHTIRIHSNDEKCNIKILLNHKIMRYNVTDSFNDDIKIKKIEKLKHKLKFAYFEETVLCEIIGDVNFDNRTVVNLLCSNLLLNNKYYARLIKIYNECNILADYACVDIKIYKPNDVIDDTYTIQCIYYSSQLWNISTLLNVLPKNIYWNSNGNYWYENAQHKKIGYDESWLYENDVKSLILFDDITLLKFNMKLYCSTVNKLMVDEGLYNCTMPTFDKTLLSEFGIITTFFDYIIMN